MNSDNIFTNFFTDWRTRVHVTVHAVLIVRHDSPLHILPVSSQVRLFAPRIYNCTNRPCTYESEYSYDSSLYVCFRVRFFPVHMFSGTILPCAYVSEYDSLLHVSFQVRFFPARFIPSTVAPRTFALRTVCS
jgi:hypothetical protein